MVFSESPQRHLAPLVILVAPRVGFEPTTIALTVHRSDQLSYRGMLCGLWELHQRRYVYRLCSKELVNFTYLPLFTRGFSLTKLNPHLVWYRLDLNQRPTDFQSVTLPG
jgi:hypothetical protein